MHCEEPLTRALNLEIKGYLQELIKCAKQYSYAVAQLPRRFAANKLV